MKAGIAGAGIMGCLLAAALQEQGWQVTLYDHNQEETSCSHAAAGLLTPLTELEKNAVLIYQLGNEALNEHWPRLLHEYNQAFFFKRQGSLAVAHPHDRDELARLVMMIHSKLKTANIQSLDRDQLLHLEPQLTKFAAGYFFPEEGQVDAQHVLQLLKQQLQTCTWRMETVLEVRTGKMVLQDRVEYFDHVFDCRGLGAKSIFHDLRGVRGELIWLHAPEVTLTRPIRLMHPRYSLYVAPRPHHIYLVGASEIEANDISAISVRTLLELLTAVYSIHPGFSEARLIKTVTQLRPTLTDHLPKIKYSDGFLAVNGLHRHGYLIAPTLVADIMHRLNAGKAAVRYPQLWEQPL